MTLAQIYLADKESGKWAPLMASPQYSGNVVQLALATSPELIPGAEIDPKDPRRWLLVESGLGDPGAAGKQGLILLDQEALPTFVLYQDKASSDEHGVSVANMIELATQATGAWSGDKMRQAAGETADKQSLSLEKELVRLLGGEPAEDAFWAAVDDNLRQRRMRLIFVADVVTSELWQMLQFLDRTMNDVQVLALEMKQFQAAGQTALWPRLVNHDKPDANWANGAKPNGSSAVAPVPAQNHKNQAKTADVQPAEARRQTKSKQPKKGPVGSKPLPDTRFTGQNGNSWNEVSFFSDLGGRSTEAQGMVGRQIFNWAKKNATRLEWGGGATRGAFAPIYEQGSRECQLFVVTSNGWVELNLSGYHHHPPFDRVEKRKGFFDKLRDIEELDLPANAMEKRALLPLSLFTAPARLAQFLKVFEWAMVSMEAGTGELKPADKPVNHRKPSVAWPDPDESADQGANDGRYSSYESSFDELLNRKRVELDDGETDELS